MKEGISSIEDEIKMIIDVISKEYHPDKIILFGSRAKGNERNDSDLDILVLSDREKNLSRHKRGLDIRMKLSTIKTPLDILFYTHAELNRFKNMPQSFCADIFREGIVLYG